MKQYINFRSYQSQNLNNTYYELDFVFANKKIRKEIYKNIYVKHLDIMKLIKEKAWHFENYYKSTGNNKAVMIDYIEKIQNAIFKVITENNSILIYNQYLYDMDVEIEKLLHITNNKKTERNIPDFKEYLISEIKYKNN